MKITLIRHAKVNMKWEKKYDSAGFNADEARYDESPIITDKDSRLESGGRPIYVSTLKRTHDTARLLFGEDAELTETPLTREVPVSAFIKTQKKLPKNLWKAVGRTSWFLCLGSQPETRRDTRARAEKFLAELEAKGEDAIVVAHEVFLYSMERVLKKHGYRIRRENPFRIKNLEQITAEKDAEKDI